MTTTRFTGTVASLMTLDAAAASEWIRSVPFSDWHQQHRTRPDQLRPAMMTDLAWHGFGNATSYIVSTVMEHFPGCRTVQHMLSVVMPGDDIPKHVDEQPQNWIARIHVPLSGDEKSEFYVGGTKHAMKVGTVYLVNTLAVHGVKNNGLNPRIHFMFDVLR